MLPLGSLINSAAIIAGSLLGLALHSRFPDRIRLIVFQGLGLCVLVLGMALAFKSEDFLLMALAIVLGGITGELMRLEEFFASLGDRLKKVVRSKNERFTEGLVTAALIYCIGALAILGSLNEGLMGDRSLLYTKSMLDGFASIVLAATYGVGVLFSFLPVLIYQGSITMFAGALQDIFSPFLIAQLSATGGVLIVGIGINLLDIKQIRLASMLPALVYAVLLSLGYEAYQATLAP